MFAAPASASRDDRILLARRSRRHWSAGIPDIETSFRLAEPGVEEAARNVAFEAPEGVFGNPRAIDVCTSLDFALTQCPPSSQAGLITIHANYDGDPDNLLGTAPALRPRSR